MTATGLKSGISDEVEALIELFDGASRLRYVQLALFAGRTPDAEYALRLWASGRQLALRERRQAAPAGGEIHTIAVDLHDYGGDITVYLSTGDHT